MKELFPNYQNTVEQKVEQPNLDSAPTSDLDALKCWEYILNDLQGTLSSNEFSVLTAIEATSTTKDHLLLSAPSMLVYQSLIDTFLELVERSKNRLGFEHISISIDLMKEGESLQKQPHEPTTASPAPSIASVDELFFETFTRKTRLNHHYQFNTFVHGPSNQFVFAACKNIVENPGQSYNPLFIYGSTGLGKTHLLHAVGNELIARRPGFSVTYISSERFMNELIYCLRHNRIGEFRKKYRSCDMFLIDDIQFMSGNKSATQEEFFHTFNNLYETKKQIIVTSDLFPQEIPDIEERLRNRFQWGLIADIQPPDIEHRIAILLQKAKQLNMDLPIKVAEFVAGKVKRNVRELEGALHRLSAFSALQGKRVTLELAKDSFNAIGAHEMSSQRSAMLIDAIQKEVADHFRVKVADLKSKRRHKAFTLPRQVAMYLVRKYTGISLPEVGEFFGGKDHTTVLHAEKKIAATRKNDSDLAANLEALERKIERVC